VTESTTPSDSPTRTNLNLPSFDEHVVKHVATGYRTLGNPSTEPLEDPNTCQDDQRLPESSRLGTRVTKGTVSGRYICEGLIAYLGTV